MRTLLEVKESANSRYNRTGRSYEKKGLLEMYERQYEDNPGTLLLARGVVEHIFTVSHKNLERRSSRR